MNDLRGLKQKLALVSRRWEEEEYNRALAEVESLLKTWPGNAHLHIVWASLVQLQENPKHQLDEAKQALQQAVEYVHRFGRLVGPASRRSVGGTRPARRRSHHWIRWESGR